MFEDFTATDRWTKKTSSLRLSGADCRDRPRATPMPST